MYKLGLEKAEEIAWDQTANIHWIIEKAREFQKNIYWPASWEICMQVKMQQLELDMEQ